jgi:hypothetical protein
MWPTSTARTPSRRYRFLMRRESTARSPINSIITACDLGRGLARPTAHLWVLLVICVQLINIVAINSCIEVRGSLIVYTSLPCVSTRRSPLCSPQRPSFSQYMTPSDSLLRRSTSRARGCQTRLVPRSTRAWVGRYVHLITIAIHDPEPLFTHRSLCQSGALDRPRSSSPR